MSIQYLANRFEYKSDGKFDNWQIMEQNADGKFVGDCDDFCVTALYFTTDSLFKFWKELIVGSAKVHFVKTSNGGGHAVLEYDGMFIDNWSRSWVSKQYMEDTYGHEFSRIAFLWPITAIKMLFGKIKRTVVDLTGRG